MKITKEVIQLLTGYQTAGISDDDFDTLAKIALARLQGMLCNPELSLDALPEVLAPVLADLFVWTATNNPQSEGIQSETAENYSYTRSSEDEANYLVRLRNKYGDILNGEQNKCEAKDGEMLNARHNPLWTPDFYQESELLG